MIARIADYTVSPLALGTRANYRCVKEGRTSLCLHEGWGGLPEPFVASVMDGGTLARACEETGISLTQHTRFEQMAILAAARALQETGIRADSPRLLFVVATTKGNVELLDGRCAAAYPSGRWKVTEAARQVTRWFHNPNDPLVVCNACISGLSAQLEAVRALRSGRYDQVAVVGADVLSPFIVSGFQSLKALSDSRCRPFDEDRTGLNLGEAAACIVYARLEDAGREEERWCLKAGAVRNDAWHLSGPSKTAEGAYRALRQVAGRCGRNELAFVSLHGTATMFNDEMEAVALDRAGMGNVPAFGLKGYIGHTMGAAGVVETLISMEALEDGTVPATKGFESLGVSRKVSVSAQSRPAHGTAFLKMMSGFGGGNAALLFGKETCGGQAAIETACPATVTVTHTVRLTPHEAVVDGQKVPVELQGRLLPDALYYTHIKDYPKFHKMDPLSKLGFVASELLLEAEAREEGVTRFAECEDRAVVLVGRTASVCADQAYQQTISHAGDYYPSPSAFIYTLPNIVTGEIAIRNRWHGETVYLAQPSSEGVETLLRQALRFPGTRSVLGGWINVDDAEHFEAEMCILIANH